MTAAFGTLFNEIYFHRFGDDGSIAQIVRVPLTYAPKDKLLLRAAADPDATKEMAITLPRMAFELIPPFSYDGTRKLSHLTKYVMKDETQPNKLKRQYIPVPYDLTYNLYVYANNIEDGNKIIEQILPFFTPDWTLSINIIPEMDVTLDIPIVLSGVTLEDKYDGNFIDRRVLVWTLTFTMKTYFFGPIKSKPIIKFAFERFIVPPVGTDTSAAVANSDILQTIQVSPGLDANGNPTSNAAITVDANTIYVDDDFGFIETFSSGPITFV
jgi:hypothetical protein